MAVGCSGLAKSKDQQINNSRLTPTKLNSIAKDESSKDSRSRPNIGLKN